MPPHSLQPNAFARVVVSMTRDNFTYLGIEEGAPTRLVLGWSPYGDLRNLWMLAVRMLDRIVGSRNVPDYRLAVVPLSYMYYQQILYCDLSESWMHLSCYVIFAFPLTVL